MRQSVSHNSTSHKAIKEANMKNILVVEDDEFIREDVAEIMGLAGYDVRMAVHGKDALEKTLESTPDLIVSDISMPVLDGLGMLHILRMNSDTENIPVIFLTSKAERSDLRNAMDSGADDYIVKPFNGDELLRAVENRFRRVDVLSRKKIANREDFRELDELNANNLEQLIHQQEVHSYQKKQIIYKEGHNPFHLYYIRKGKVRTYKTHEDGKQLVMSLFNEGEYLGYLAILEQAAYNETAEAMEETELEVLPRKEFEQLISANPAVQAKFIKMLANNVVENENHLLGIAYDTLRKKVAKALINYLNKYHGSKVDGFTIDISRDELASIAGTATESLIRALTEFKHEQLIDIHKDNKIEILNPRKLGALLR